MGDDPADPSPTAVATTVTDPDAGADAGVDIGAPIGAGPVTEVASAVDGGVVDDGDDVDQPGATELFGGELDLLPCTWCGAAGPDVVPLVAGRASRRRVVAAICPRCVDAHSAGGGLSSLLIAAFGVLALASLWVWSIPGRPSSRTTSAIAVGWIAAVVAYGFQAVRAARGARHGSGGLRSWRWAVPPLLGLLVAVAVLLALPLRGRFALSRAAVASAADDAVSGVVRHSRLVAYPGGLLVRIDGSTGVLVDARRGFFRSDPPDAAAPEGSTVDGGSAAGGAATAGGASGTGGATAGPVELVDAVDLGGGWRAGCLTAPAEPAAPAG